MLNIIALVYVLGTDGESTVQTKDGQNFVAVPQPGALVQASSQQSVIIPIF